MSILDDIVESALERAFQFPLKLGNGPPNSEYFQVIRQVFVTQNFEIMLWLNAPEKVYSIFATHDAQRDPADNDGRTVICAANMAVPAAIHERAPHLLESWMALGASRLSYSFDDGLIVTQTSSSEYYLIAEDVTVFRFKFLSAAGGVIEDPVTILRAMSLFHPLFRSFVLYSLYLNDPAQDSNVNPFQISQAWITGWPGLARFGHEILAKEWFVLREHFAAEMAFLNGEAYRAYRESLTQFQLDSLNPYGFRDLQSVAYLGDFESQMTGGLIQYVLSRDQLFYLVIYDASVFTVDLLHVPRASNVIDFVAGLGGYISVVNGPMYKEGPPVLHLGGRKFAVTHDGGPPSVLNIDHAGWNAASTFLAEFTAKLVASPTGRIDILSGNLSQADLDNSASATDSLILVVHGGDSKLERFRDDILGVGGGSFSGLGATFLGTFRKTAKEFFFVLIKENNGRMSFVSDPYPVYQSIFDALDADEVVYPDGSGSVALFHGDFQAGPHQGGYSTIARDRNENMPALFGVRRR